MNTLKAYVAIIVAAMGFSSCSMSGKASIDDEKDYTMSLTTIIRL